MDVAKQANKVIKAALEKMSEKNDLARFSNIPKIFNDASGALEGDERNAALLKGWMVSQANNAVFLLWRRGILTDEIESEYRKLPSTEEAVKDFEAFEEADKKVADKLEEERKKYMDSQHELDIFKAILNGIPKERAEAQYKEYKDKMAQVAQGR